MSKSKRVRDKKANAKAKRDRQQHREDKKLLTDNDLMEMLRWKERIEANVQAAIACHKTMQSDGLLDDPVYRTALAKYVENATEALQKFDNASRRELLDELIEVPEWKKIKGMREVVAHEFWRIDYNIIFSRVTNEFPVLADLFRLLLINESVIAGSEITTLSVDKWAIPRVSKHGVEPLFGQYAILASYSVTEGWIPGRITLVEDPPEYISGIIWSTTKQKEGKPMSLLGVHLKGKQRGLYLKVPSVP